MSSNMVEKRWKVVLTSMLIFILVGLVLANILRKDQDKTFENNYIEYNQLVEAYSTGDINSAFLIGTNLLKKIPSSEQVNYVTGLAALDSSDYNMAAVLLQKTLDLNPHKVEDPIFMINFGEALFYSEKLSEAQIVLMRCKDSGWMPENYPDYQNRVSELLDLIKGQ